SCCLDMLCWYGEWFICLWFSSRNHLSETSLERAMRPTCKPFRDGFLASSIDEVQDDSLECEALLYNGKKMSGLPNGAAPKFIRVARCQTVLTPRRQFQ